MAAIVTVDRNGTITHWDIACEHLFDRDDRSLQVHACHGRGFARYVDTGSSTLPEIATAVGRHKNGHPVRIQISTRTLADDRGRITEVEGVMLAC